MDELNLDRVVELLSRENVTAHVETTGGGDAAIFAEPVVGYHECTCTLAPALTVHDDGCPVPERGGSPRYAAIAGPGSYGWGKRASIAHLDDFYVGPDDSGEGTPISPLDVGARTEADVVKLIAAQAQRPDPRVVLTFDELEELGFDGTGRSRQ